MITEVETGQLLVIVKAFDNRKLDPAVARVWAMQLGRNVPQATYQEAEAVVMDWFSTDNPYFELRHLVDGLKRKHRMMPAQVEADVRAAKAFGLLDKSHPASERLPVEAAQALAGARAARVAATRELTSGGEGDRFAALPAGFGDVGRRAE